MLKFFNAVFLIFIAVFICLFVSSCQKDTKNTEDNYAYDHICDLPLKFTGTLDELSSIKNAIDSAKPGEAPDFIWNIHNRLSLIDMTDYESSKRFYDEIASSSVPLIDNDINNFDEVNFYLEDHYFYQLDVFDGDKRISSKIFTPQSNIINVGVYGKNVKKAKFKKTIENDGVTADIYFVKEENIYCADVFVGDTYIFMRSKNISTIEEFEECFLKFTFVKIGDLINRLPEKTE